MDEKIAFEHSLYEDYGDETVYMVDDVDFFVDRMVLLPKIRPLWIEKGIKLCAEYCRNGPFRLKLLSRIHETPVLLYHMFLKGFYTIDDILPFLDNENSFMLCIYFMKELLDFEQILKNKRQPPEFDESLLLNKNNIAELIKYGYLPSTIGYCLKYDDIGVVLENYSLLSSTIKWSPRDVKMTPFINLFNFWGHIGWGFGVKEVKK